MNPFDARLLHQAEGYLELELPDAALEALERISEEARESEAFTYSYLAGEAHRSAGRFHQAIEHLHSARKARPGDIGTAIGLGWCYKRTENLQAAIDALLDAERACRFAKENSLLPLVLYNLSCYFSLALNKDKMLEYLRSAIELDADYRARVVDESDFDAFRDDPDFLELVSDRI